MVEKDLSYYMALPYKIELCPDPDEGGFTVSIPTLKGCISVGETAEEALDMIAEAKELWLETALEEGWPIPEPQEEEIKTYSGKFVVRLPRYLHRRLAELAENEGTSLNQLIVAFLAESSERQRDPSLAASQVKTTTGPGLPLHYEQIAKVSVVAEGDPLPPEEP